MNSIFLRCDSEIPQALCLANLQVKKTYLSYKENSLNKCNCQACFTKREWNRYNVPFFLEKGAGILMLQGNQTAREFVEVFFLTSICVGSK